MNKTLSMFVVLMLVLTAVPFVFAQNTTDIEVITGDATEAIPVVASTEDATAVSDSPVNATAETEVTETANTTTETTTVQVGKEYSTLDSALDRIRLAFSFQEERKLELINKIEQRRTQHYSFLVSKGKTEQAERFKEKTTGLEKNFEQWKEKRAEKLAKLEAKKENAISKVERKLTEKANKIERKVQEKADKLAERVEKIDENLTQREAKILEDSDDDSSETDDDSERNETEDDSKDDSAKNETESD